MNAIIPRDLHGDTALLTWNLWHVTEAALGAENPYRAPSVYFPVGGNLTTHTYTPGFLPIGLVVRTFMEGDPSWPLVAYRATTWISFAVGLFLAYHALRALGAGVLSSVAGSVAWTLAAPFRSRPFETHLVSATFLVPLLALALGRCVARPTVSRAVAAAITAGLSVYFSEYYTPFLWLALIALVLFAALRGHTRAALRTIVEALGGRGIAAAASAFLLTTAPFFVNWTPTRVERFNEGQAYFESANLAGFVVPDPTATRLYSSFRAIDRLNARVRRGVGGAAVFLGFPVLIFGVIGLARADPRIRWILLSSSLTFLVLSLGPELKVFETNTRVPLPYRALMLVPPFDLARAPARLAAIGLWPLIGLQALGLSHASTVLGRWRGAAALAVVSLAWSAAEGRAHGPAPAPFRPPEELLHLPPGAVLNLPLSDRDSFAMFLQVFHGRPIATGHLSRRSPDQITHLGRLGELIAGDPQSFGAQMRQMGIATVVLARGAGDDVVERIRQTRLHIVDLRAFD